MLATLWWPDTNPIGPGSLIPLAVILVYVGLAFVLRSRGLPVCGVGFFSILAIFYYLLAFAGRSFPGAADYIGLYLLCLTAACLSLEVARSGPVMCFWLGAVVLFVVGWFLSSSALERWLQSTEWRQVMTDGQRLVLSLAGWCVVYAALIAHILVRRRSRLSDNDSPQRTGSASEPVRS